MTRPTKEPTMKIEQMDRPAVKTLSAAIRAALDAVATEYGVNIKVGGGSFDPGAGTFKPKVEVTLDDAAERQWQQWGPMFGFAVEDFGREFTASGKQFRISGVNLKARKRPILATEVGTDRGYSFDADALLRILKVAA
jgi:hypothetical protein